MGLPGLNTYGKQHLVNVPHVTIPCVTWHGRTVKTFHNMNLAQKITAIFQGALIYPTLGLLWFASFFARTKPIYPAPKDPYLEKVAEIKKANAEVTAVAKKAGKPVEASKLLALPPPPCKSAIEKEIEKWDRLELAPTEPSFLYFAIKAGKNIDTISGQKEGVQKFDPSKDTFESFMNRVKEETADLVMPGASTYYYSVGILIVTKNLDGTYKSKMLRETLNGSPDSGSWGHRYSDGIEGLARNPLSKARLDQVKNLTPDLLETRYKKEFQAFDKEALK